MEDAKRRTMSRDERLALSVIAFFGVVILVEILWLVLKPARDENWDWQASRCMSNLKQLASAMAAYCRDNGGRYPAAENWNSLILPYAASELGPCGGDRRVRTLDKSDKSDTSDRSDRDRGDASALRRQR